MDIKRRVEIAVLVKYYGGILTEKQREIISMYVDNNLSFKEVSEELQITRQAVKDSLDNAIETLENTENKLHFIARDDKIKKLLENKLSNQIDMSTRLEILSILEGN
ncbi:MAG TPA: hypothetical protein IAC46_02545 [Candidatus Onthoplasma faecigallinarum]|nr:hypothetical protein [Candidatus Onthoplasma faecigallinarum]